MYDMIDNLANNPKEVVQMITVQEGQLQMAENWEVAVKFLQMTIKSEK